VNPKTDKAFVDIRCALYGACRSAKIDNLILLDLRRTFATRLIESGVDIISVGQLLGHTSVTTTQIYTMTNQEEKRHAVYLLDAKNRENLLRDMGKPDEQNNLQNCPLFSMS
jgi:integrase